MGNCNSSKQQTTHHPIMLINKINHSRRRTIDATNNGKRGASNKLSSGSTIHQKPRLVTYDNDKLAAKLDDSGRSGDTRDTRQPSLAFSSDSSAASSHQPQPPSQSPQQRQSSRSRQRRRSATLTLPSSSKAKARRTKQPPTFKDTYQLLPQSKLGHGIAGTVHQCIHRQTSHLCAVKVINKKQVRRQDRLRREVSFLKQVSHPNIIQMYDCYEDEDTVHIVTEVCNGGELFDKVVDKAKKGNKKTSKASSRSTDGSRASTRKSAQDVSTTTPACFNERDAARIIHSLLSAVSYLHANNIVHRDIKPENILVVDKDDDSSPIKLIDFGLSIRHDPETCPPLSNTVGTSYYMAPELLDGSYDKACDLWSVGVIAYVMLSGRPPFNGTSDETIFRKIRKGQYKMEAPEIWDGISDYAKDFIKCLLTMDTKKRWTADMAMEHAWLKLALQDDKEFSDFLLSKPQ